MKYRESIAIQPQSLEASRRAVGDALDAIDLAPLERASIALVGIGASLHAAQAGAAHPRARGGPAPALCPPHPPAPGGAAAGASLAPSPPGRSPGTGGAGRPRPAAPARAVS